MQLKQSESEQCHIYYTYKIRKDWIVDLEIYKECWKPIRAATTVGYIIGLIVGIGTVLILLWKAKLVRDDRKEYARFMENLKNGNVMKENPLYNSPIRKYEIPKEFLENTTL